MVSQAIDEGLLHRIQRYVADDINSRIPMEGTDAKFKLRPADIYILSFERVLNSWKAVATAQLDVPSYYEIVHDGGRNTTLVNIYMKYATNPAII